MKFMRIIFRLYFHDFHDFHGSRDFRLKDTTTICKNGVKSLFLLFRDYFPSAKLKSYEFLANDRIGSELYFFGHFDHDSYL